MQNSRIRLLVVLGVIALTAALYFAPRKIEKKVSAENPSGFSIEDQITEVKGRLKEEEKNQIVSFEDLLKKNPDDKQIQDSLGKLWDRFQTPQISSYYYEEIAKSESTEQNWINAAFRYFDAFKMTGDSLKRVFFVNKAIDCYKKVIEINPKNYDAKTDLGVCYAEGTSNPMQGILMLREVVQEAPKHVMAQYNLGVLSVKSGQLDKAVDRFENVLAIDPTIEDARFLLGKTYMQMGNNASALKNFDILRKESKNPALVKEVESLISKINNH
ncbi:MAG TPA: tetratricopeptide repeat protein [Bacteroidia bacterium]|nr:tetratricopeptide repeat protein [Bacteroidota bacterium]HQV98839.1 tetratricopeptide repeat protein [Bacteroidia bacterium]